MATFFNRATLSYSGGTVNSNVTTGESYPLVCNFTGRQKDILKAGSLLAYVARG